MKIRKLRQNYGEFGWSWIIQDEDYKGDITETHYCTNMDGEGLWKECIIGRMVYADGRTGTATSMKQIVGTCQYSMVGCNTYGSAYSHIKRWFKEV